MKSFSLALLAIGLFVSPALCAETTVASKIDAVDLHTDGAEVTRVAHSKLEAGETSIVLSGLSPNVIEQSIRVSGLEMQGISLRSVVTRRQTPKARTPSAETQALLDEQEVLRGRLDALNTKRRMITNVAETRPDIAIGTAGSATPAEFWPSIWTKVADALEDTDRRLRETQKRLDAVTATLADKEKSERSAALSASTVEVVLDLSVDHAAETDFKLVYQVGGAIWRPAYDARLRTDRPPAQLELIRRAKVMQSSGEDWTDVALTLSTSSLSAATTAAMLGATSDVTGNRRDGVTMPEVAPPDPAPTFASPVGPVRYDFSKTIRKDPLAGAELYNASIALPGRVSLANDTKFKTLSVGSRTIDAEISIRSVPIVDSRAYLQAKFENLDRVPLVPGEVQLFRDGAFIGRTALKGAAPGDHVTIGFGIDDLVSVERTDVRRKERNTTVKTGVASIERAFKTVVTNRHSFPVRIEIDDREPTFNNAAILFKELPGMTSPTDREVDGRRGVLAWTYLYAPGETRSIALGWNVRWPAKLGPPQPGYDQTMVFRFSGGATF